MKKILVIAAIIALSMNLSGCFFAGAGAGYVYKDEQDKGKVP